MSDWVKCPICRQPDMQCVPEGEDGFLITCTNKECASNKPVEYPSSPQKPSADEITKFENWAKGKNLPTMPNGDVYVHVESQMAWEAWQARAKLRDVSPARGGGE